MSLQAYTRRQYRRSQHHGHAAPPRYRAQSPGDSQQHQASWTSDYICEPAYSDSDNYINPQGPRRSPGHAQYEPSSSMSSSSYSLGRRGARNKHPHYTSSPYQPRWPTRSRCRTPSPDSDYIVESARTEDDYIATPAKAMPGAFVEDTPDYGGEYAEYGPEASSPLPHPGPRHYARGYARDSSRPHPRSSIQKYNSHHAKEARESGLRSSNWDRKHDSLRMVSRSRSRSRNKRLEPHELENFEEARQFLERFRALEVRGAHRTTHRPAHCDAAYSSDEDRDDRSLRSRRSGSSRNWRDNYSLARRSSPKNVVHDSARPLHRISHSARRGSSAERNARYSPARQSRRDGFKGHTGHRYRDDDDDDDQNASDMASYRSASSGRVSRAASSTPSYVSHGPSPTRSYVSDGPSPTRSSVSRSPSRSSSHSAARGRSTRRRSRSSSDNGIAEGSDYLPSDDDHADGAHSSDGDGGHRHRYHSDDNGVGEGSDYLSSNDDDDDDRVGGRYSSSTRYQSGARGNETYPGGIKRGWGM